MKSRFLLFLLAFICSLASVKAADAMSITVNATSEPDLMEVRSFAVGTQLFTNRTNAAINNIPAEFEGYEILSSGAASDLIGTITASSAGRIYIMVRVTEATKTTGWTHLVGANFTYATNNSEMAILYKEVTAGEEVTIPVNTDFRRVTPLAKKINIPAAEEYVFDDMEIEVETSSDFQIKTFAEGVVYFANRAYTLYGTPTEVHGYNFLSSNAGVGNDGVAAGGTIIASRNGDIYLMGRTATAVTGWSLLPNTEFFYDAGSSIGALSIFKKTVTAGERVEIPFIDNFQEVKPLAKKINMTTIALADDMKITIEVTSNDATIFDKRQFSNGAQLFTNRTYQIEGVSSLFQGYDFLASEGAKVDKGVIIPSADGVIYIIGKSGGLLGWQQVSNADFTYVVSGTPTAMSIYEKAVKKGERVEIPQIENFQGATPLAKTIELKVVADQEEVRAKSISIDGVPLTNFSGETDLYNYYLPYTYTTRPLVETTTVSSSATVILAETEDVNGTEDERTATITVTSADNTQTKVYKIIFTVIPKLDLYLSIGQSNMAGYAPLDESKGDLNSMNNVFLLNKGNMFEQAKNPLNQYSTIAAGSSTVQLGPSYSFSRAIASRSEAPVGMVVNARGGSSIENWTKGGTGEIKDTLYAPTMVRALEAMKWGEYKGILWHQGEANKGDLTTYSARLSQFVSDLRTDLGNDTLLFVAGQIGRFGLNVENFNNLIMTISDFIDHSACVSSEGLGNIPGDNNHFNREAALILGERYAKIVADKLYAPNEMEVTIEADAGIFEKKQLETDVQFFTNRPTYTITDTNLGGFQGYDFLSSGGGEKESGIMIPSTSGYLYVIADSTLSLSGWSPMLISELHYTGSTLRVFRKYVEAGERVAIPSTTNFRGVSPIAKSIILKEIFPEKDTRLSEVKVDGLPLADFSKEVLNYKYYLPYTATTVPQIIVSTQVEEATSSVIDAINLGGNETDRTSVIQVTSADGTQIQSYTITFEVLPEMDLFLCIGQSNMAGAAKLDASKGDYEPITNAFLLNADNKFEIAKNGMNRYANVLTSSTSYYGLTYAFAQTMVTKTGKELGFVVNARGGSAIQLWDKNGTGVGDTLYVKTLERALEAQKWGTYRAILWHQGEANRTNFESIQYMNRLNDLVTNLRTDLGNDTLLFVAGEIGHWRPDNAPFNTLISSIADHIPHTACVSAQGLINITNLADNDSHFNRDGLIILGDRYADIVYSELYTSFPVSLEESEMDGISIKSEGNRVQISCDEKSNCKIIDLMGRVIHQSEINDSSIIELSNKGIYIVYVENSVNRKSSKILIQ